MRRLCPAILLVVVALFGLAACAKTQVDRFAVNEDLTKVVLDVGAGNVTITGTNDLAVSVRRIIHKRGKKPTLSQTTNDGVLTIKARCSGGLFRSCRVDHELAVPTHLPVEVRASSGTITIAHLQETIDVRTESGSVRVTEPGGRTTVHTGSGNLDVDKASDDLTLDTGSGTISATRLTTGIVKATTGSGRVTLQFEEAPDDVEVQTGSGAINVKVPSQSYTVEPKTSSGKITVKGLKTGTAGGHIKATTGSGNISIQGVG